MRRKRKGKKKTDESQSLLIELPPRLVTKHGTYIDGFAGPQEPDTPAMWAARLVLEMRPAFLRHFHLCEKAKYKVKLLESLKREQPEKEKGRKLGRTIDIYTGDFNKNIHSILKPGRVDDKAVFCLLDQRAFECHWATVKLIADYKRSAPTKIEQFYFLATSWIARSFSGFTRNKEVVGNWWGRGDWTEVMKWPSSKVLEETTCRFRDELGYRNVRAYPICAHKDLGSRVMYHMIHATDHPAAPELMTRAYNTALKKKDTQMHFEDLFAARQ